ncbi:MULTISPECIES: hypothetical protein [Pseudomonadaceae]|jgi:hypothetical protein|nr:MULTISPECIES: hypothetical protein [Pseudomonas]
MKQRVNLVGSFSETFANMTVMEESAQQRSERDLSARSQHA